MGLAVLSVHVVRKGGFGSFATEDFFLLLSRLLTGREGKE